MGGIWRGSALTVYNKMSAGEPETGIEEYCLTNPKLKGWIGCRVYTILHLKTSWCRCVCHRVCVVHIRDRQPMAASAQCVRVLLEMCHVCDKLTLIRQTHHALGVCSGLHMSVGTTGSVKAQSNRSRVIRHCKQAMCEPHAPLTRRFQTFGDFEPLHGKTFSKEPLLIV